MVEKLSVADVLERAADLIEPEGRWCKGDFARTANGDSLENGFDIGAACFCAIGAIEHVAGDLDSSTQPRATLRIVLPVKSIAAFNDAPERTQAEVVAKLREAAALAKELSNV